MPRLSRIEQREATRRRLIESGERVFARMGFEAAPIDLIAEEAGFSRGAFYSNFSSKDEIFMILLNEHLDAEIETLSLALSQIERAEDMVPAIERRYRVLDEDSSWCLLATEFQLYATRGGKMAGDFVRTYERYRMRLGEIIAAQCERLRIDLALTPYELGVAQIALSHGLALQRAANGNIPQSITAKALAMLLRGAIRDG